MPANLKQHIGICLAILMLNCWPAPLTFSLHFPTVFTQSWSYLLLLLLQTHLYTGLFIMAHDAMHVVVVPGNRTLNNGIGTICGLLFAFNWYPRLFPKHHGHHKLPELPRTRITTLKRNHLRAFVSCYFFGYHYEHHDKPAVPWWQLYREKEKPESR
jgi:fatty acid desaturase